jgi:threonyl-tRNA synthetase
VTAGTTGLDLYGDDRSVVAVRVNGEPRDLQLPFSEGDEIEPISISSDEGLAILRHSTAHVLAQAAEAKLGIGPPITDGFYYDFDVAEPYRFSTFNDGRCTSASGVKTQ